MRRIVGVVLFLGVVPAACTDGRTPAVPGASSITASATETAASAEQDLSQLLLASVPGYTVEPDNDKAQTLDSAAAFADDPELMRNALEAAGFERGHVRILTNDEGDAIQEFVYEVRAQSDAETLRGYLNDDAVQRLGGTLFDVPEIPDATGIEVHVSNEQGQSFETRVLFVVGRRLYSIGVLDIQEQPVRATAIDLAKQLAAIAR